MLTSHAQLYLLVAGPDWLTSVLAGMMGTSVWRVLASQTAPSALLLSLPATFAGAFQLRIHEGGAFGALSSALLFLAAAVQARPGRAAPRCFARRVGSSR
jgi:hypothetical protein